MSITTLLLLLVWVYYIGFLEGRRGGPGPPHIPLLLEMTPRLLA